MADETKLIYQLHDKLKLAHKGHAALRRVAEMPEEDKKAIMHLVAYVASQTGKDLKQVLVDVKEAAWPTRRIENDALVEREVLELKNELALVNGFANDLSLFSEAYIAELKDRAYLAEGRAEQLRAERERQKKRQEAKKKQQQEAIRGGALPFPDTEAG